MTTTHSLPFEAAPWVPGMILKFGKKKSENVVAFRVGTCEGIYSVSKRSYDIITVINDKPGNGHFEDVLQWFEQSCRRDKKALRFMEIMNDGFGKHLMAKRGFRPDGSKNLIKIFV